MEGEKNVEEVRALLGRKSRRSSEDEKMNLVKLNQTQDDGKKKLQTKYRIIAREMATTFQSI